MHSVHHQTESVTLNPLALLSTAGVRPQHDVAAALGPTLPPVYGKILLPHQFVGVKFLLRHMIGEIQFARHRHCSQSEAGSSGLPASVEDHGGSTSEALYQTEQSAKLGSGCLLADYMGLGKTIQTIATLSVLFSTREMRRYCKYSDHATVPHKAKKAAASPTLHVTIVCPAPVVQGWCEEFMKWSTRLDEHSERHTGPEGSTGSRKRTRHSGKRNTPSKFFVFRHDDSPLQLLGSTCGARDGGDNPSFWVFPISSSLSESDRRLYLERYMDLGGILVIGFEMFSLVFGNEAERPQRKETASRSSVLSLTPHRNAGASTSNNPTATGDDADQRKKSKRRHCVTFPIDIIVVDEAHRLRNEGSAVRSLLMRSIPTHRRILLTGYPLQNNAMCLGPLEHFKHYYARALEEYCFLCNSAVTAKEPAAPQSSSVSPSLRGTRAQATTLAQTESKSRDEAKVEAVRLRALLCYYLVEPLVLRRGGAYLERMLPQRFIYTVYVRPSLSQRAAYNAYLMSGCASTATHRFALVPFTAQVFAAPLSKLKPRMENLNYADDETKERLCALFDVDNVPPKFHIIMAICKAALVDRVSPYAKIVIFSQYLVSLNALERFLRDELSDRVPGTATAAPVYRVDGSTPLDERQRICAEFTDPKVRVGILLFSLRAGSEGLNLFAASTVISLDLWWNPAVEQEAFGRTFRIGQRQISEVFILATPRTTEEAQVKLKIGKELLQSLVVDAGWSALGQQSRRQPPAKAGVGIEPDAFGVEESEGTGGSVDVEDVELTATVASKLGSAKNNRMWTLCTSELPEDLCHDAPQPPPQPYADEFDLSEPAGWLPDVADPPHPLVSAPVAEDGFPGLLSLSLLHSSLASYATMAVDGNPVRLSRLVLSVEPATSLPQATLFSPSEDDRDTNMQETNARNRKEFDLAWEALQADMHLGAVPKLSERTGEALRRNRLDTHSNGAAGRDRRVPSTSPVLLPRAMIPPPSHSPVITPDSNRNIRGSCLESVPEEECLL